MRSKVEVWAGRIMLAGAIGIAAIGPVFAQTGQLQPVQSTLQTLTQTLTGAIATSLAVLAVIAAGFMAFVGRLTWGIAGSIVFGITLVFGSAQIVSFFQSAVGR